MRLTEMRIRHFRNLGVQQLEVPPEGAAIVGGNAQGKTNFLEAVYYLETFRSFRSAREEELVAFGEPAFRVAGVFRGERGDTEIAAAFQRDGRRKKVTVDGVGPDRLGDALGHAAAVLFSPADVALVSEGPGERRRFLDVVLSLNVPGYLEALQHFRHVLAQRNASLREQRPRAQIGAWDAALTKAGAQVMEARRRWVRDYAPTFSERHEAVAGGQRATLRYEPAVPLEGAEGVEHVAEAYRSALAATEARERRMGVTMAGPHRDELAILLQAGEGWLDARRFGSGGQRRTAAFALRLSEAETVRETRRRQPLVLLDDVFAELDPGRSERVLELIERKETGQVILTAPRDDDVRLRRESIPRWCIRNGRLFS